MSSDRPSFIQKRLFLGSICHANDLELCQQLGITHVLTIGTVRPRRFTGIEYRALGICDHPDAFIRSEFDRCIRYLQNVLRQGGVALVHCFAGVSRSATIIIAYVMRTKNFTYREAYGFVKRRRPMIKPNCGFQQQLVDYSRDLHSS